MKKVILGLVIGSGIIYLARKMQNDGQFETYRKQVNKFLSKSKRNLKNVADIAQNEVEYLKERVEDATQNKSRKHKVAKSSK